MKTRPLIKRWNLSRLALGALVPCLTGYTLVAAADSDQSEQEAFDRYFGLKNSPSDDNDWTTHFRIGAVVGLNISAKFNENAMFSLNSSKGTYDDGYVRSDSTGSPDGLTWNWGYDNASQYNAAAQTLTFHHTTSYTPNDSGSQVAGGPFPGFDLEYGGNIYKWDSFHIGWDLGFDLLPMNISDNSSMSASVTQITYTFKTGTMIPPGPGYQGGYNGPGPLLPTTGTSSPPETGLAGNVSGSRSLDMMLYAIRLGPTFTWDFTKDFSASLGIGPAMGIVSAEYKYDETISTASSTTRSSGSFTGLDVVFGGDVNATLLYHMQDKGQPVDLYLSAQYMPLGSADFSQGGRDGRVDLSGQVYISAGVNWAF